MKKELQLRARRDIEIQVFINRLRGARERIHVADVVVTSPRADEVLNGVSGLLNDACADLDELIDKCEPLLKFRERAGPRP